MKLTKLVMFFAISSFAQDSINFENINVGDSLLYSLSEDTSHAGDVHPYERVVVSRKGKWNKVFGYNKVLGTNHVTLSVVDSNQSYILSSDELNKLALTSGCNSKGFCVGQEVFTRSYTEAINVKYQRIVGIGFEGVKNPDFVLVENDPSQKKKEYSWVRAVNTNDNSCNDDSICTGDEVALIYDGYNSIGNLPVTRDSQIIVGKVVTFSKNRHSNTLVSYNYPSGVCYRFGVIVELPTGKLFYTDLRSKDQPNCETLANPRDQVVKVDDGSFSKCPLYADIFIKGDKDLESNNDSYINFLNSIKAKGYAFVSEKAEANIQLDISSTLSGRCGSDYNCSTFRRTYYLSNLVISEHFALPEYFIESKESAEMEVYNYKYETISDLDKAKLKAMEETLNKISELIPQCRIINL